MNPAPFDKQDFAISASPGARAHIIEIISGQIVTEHIVDELRVENGRAVADTGRDLLKMAVIERHRASGNIGLGFVKGFGIKRGAIATSVGHDSHNLIVLGTSDADMSIAGKAVVEMGGGFSAVIDGEVVGRLELPLAGLMSLESVQAVESRMEKLKAVANGMGSAIDDPFMLLGFLALPVIPKLKLTDKGLVDVEKFSIIELIAN